MSPFCWKCGAAPATTPTGVFDLPPLAGSDTALKLMDLNHLLESNDVPSDSDTPLVTARLSAEQEQVDALDPQIAELEVTLDRLVRRRQKLVESIRKHRAVLSSVRRVSPELLCEIFALKRLGEEPVKAPWRLGHICQSWRRAVLGNPFFWNSVTIPNLWGSPNQNLALSRMDLQLLRSASTPLTVYWCAEKHKKIDLRSADAVLSHCGRWNGLHLDVPCDGADLTWLIPASGRLTALRTFKADFGFLTQFPDILSVVESIREVILTDWFLYYPSPSILVPWGQITHYRGAYVTTTQRHILAAAPNLLQCAVNFEPPLVLGPPITLPQLRGLRVERPKDLLHLTTPSLENLFSVCHSRLDLPEFARFLRRSSCSLKQLVLRDCTICSGLIEILRELPLLTYLLVDFDGADSPDQQEQGALFTAMTVSGISSELCPELDTLVYGASGAFPP
ncbi:hypothetical protein DFH06DRAFT_1479007 [Mycena polygramma]|nr:hypothetical protein DFH06DRAFT_1479007 [Mycena polygramma]